MAGGEAHKGGANEELVGKESGMRRRGSPPPSYQISIFPCMRIVERSLQKQIRNDEFGKTDTWEL